MGDLFSLLKTARKVAAEKGLGRIPGAKKVYALLFNQLKPDRVFVQGNLIYINPKERGVGLRLLKKGVYEEYATEVFKKTVKRGMVVVDVGAHIGYYSLIAANLLGPEGKVYSFEPYPPSYKLLIKNIHANKYRNVIPLQKALSNKEGKAILFLDQKVSGNNSLSMYNVTGLANSIEVEVTTLDTYFEEVVRNFEVDFVKIDTQGAEGLVIQGMTKIIEKNDNLKMMIEFWPFGLANMSSDPPELLNELDQYGFKLQRINEQTRRIDHVGVNELMEICAQIRSKQTNLLLEK